jgi:hypothetical protein
LNRLLVLPFHERWVARERIRRGETIYGGALYALVYAEEGPSNPDVEGGWTAKEMPPPPEAPGLPPDPLALAYKTLGVQDGATEAEVRAAFKKIAFEHHPDRGGDVTKFKDAGAARDRILAFLKG